MGRYSEFWYTFLIVGWPPKDPFYDPSSFLTRVDPRDVNLLLVYRRRLARVTGSVYSGLVFLTIASSCQTWTGPAGGTWAASRPLDSACGTVCVPHRRVTA